MWKWLCLTLLFATPVAAQDFESRLLAVYVTGAVPGIAEPAPVFARLLMDQHIDGWIFLPGAVSNDNHLADDRIVWTVKPIAGKDISVEVRVYLDGLYRTMSFATAELKGGADDPKLVAMVTQVSKSLFAIGLKRRS